MRVITITIIMFNIIAFAICFTVAFAFCRTLNMLTISASELDVLLSYYLHNTRET